MMCLKGTQANRGFSMLELLIVMIIITILAGLLLPIYINYLNKVKYSEVMGMVGPYKIGVEACVHATNSLSQCSSGQNTVPVAFSASSSTTGYTASVDVSNGVITAQSQQISTGGVSSFTYILTPTMTADHHITWVASGSCFAAGLC